MRERYPYTEKAIHWAVTAAISLSGVMGSAEANTSQHPVTLAQPQVIFPCPEAPASPTPTETTTHIYLPHIGRNRNEVSKLATKNAGAEMIGKLIGASWGDPPDIPIINGPETRHYDQVFGADLGPFTRYGDTYYSILGDTVYTSASESEKSESNFLVAAFNCSDAPALPLVSGYLKYKNGIPVRALVNRETEPLPNSPTIPTALTTITWKGKEHMIAGYMNTPKWNNFNIAYAALAKYDDQLKLFTPYKPKTNIWSANERGVAQFALASLWEDEKEGYLYMIGAANDRFGGTKLARIALDPFLDESDQTDWQYYLGKGKWSGPTKSLDVINNEAAWLIPPKDPGWTLEKGLAQNDVDPCSLMTVTEHGLIRDSASGKFYFTYGDANCLPHGLYIHTSDSITGPWTNPPQRVEMPHPDWDYYGAYPIPRTLQYNPTTHMMEMLIVLSTYKHYGVYLYKLTCQAAC